MKNCKKIVLCFLTLVNFHLFATNNLDTAIELLQDQIEKEFGCPGQKVTEDQLGNLADWITQNLSEQSKKQPIVHFLVKKFFFEPQDYELYGNGELFFIKLFCFDCKLPLTGVDENKNTILHTVIDQHNYQQTVALLKKFILWGAPINAQNNDGNTPLNLLLTLHENYQPDQELELVKMLMNAGADISIANKKNFAPLDYAVKSQRKHTIDLVLSRGARPSKKTVALALDGFNPEIMRMMVKKVPVASITVEKKLTPLHSAVITNDLVQFKTELAKKPQATSVDIWGRTPLHWAALLGLEEMVQLLIKAGYDVMIPDVSPFALSPFEWSIFNGHTNVVNYFVPQASIINKKMGRKNGNTPLHWAVLHPDVADLLLKLGADATLTNDFDQTPLQFLEYLVCFWGELSIYKSPLEAMTFKEQDSLVYKFLEVLKKHKIIFKFKDLCSSYCVPPQERGTLWTTNALVTEHAEAIVFIALQFGVAIEAGENQDWIYDELREFNLIDMQANRRCYQELNDLFYSVVIGDLKECKKLLPKFSINIQGRCGMTLLHWAAAQGHSQLVDFLLKNGANSKIIDAHQKTAFDYAQLNGHKTISAKLT